MDRSDRLATATYRLTREMTEALLELLELQIAADPERDLLRQIHAKLKKTYESQYGGYLRER